MAKSFMAVIILCIAVFAVGGLGIYLIGSPGEVRGVKYDELRMQDISKIKTAVDYFYQDNKKMPANISELVKKDLTNTSYGYLTTELKDPKTKKDYGYKDLERGKYQVCADFETSSEDIQKRKTGLDQTVGIPSYSLYPTESSLHPKGYFCFEYGVSGYKAQSPTPEEINQDDAYRHSLSLANNTERQSDVNSILNAIGQFQVDHAGQLPGGIDATVREITDNGAKNTINLCSDLVPTYLPNIPNDPVGGMKSPPGSICTDSGAHYTTAYTVVLDTTTNKVTVAAPRAELGISISVSR